MTELQPYRSVVLENGLQLELYDVSNRYFGDYHRVRVEVRCIIPLTGSYFGDNDDDPRLVQARKLHGESLLFERSLERMGVPGGEVEDVREELVAGFLASSLGYLQHPDFVARFVQRRLAQRGGVPPFLRP